jgi:hypothetical protein
MSRTSVWQNSGVVGRTSRRWQRQNVGLIEFRRSQQNVEMAATSGTGRTACRQNVKTVATSAATSGTQAEGQELLRTNVGLYNLMSSWCFGQGTLCRILSSCSFRCSLRRSCRTWQGRGCVKELCVVFLSSCSFRYSLRRSCRTRQGRGCVVLNKARQQRWADCFFLCLGQRP